MYTSEKVTWARLCRMEPRLLKLYRKAKAIKDNKQKKYFCANSVWYGNRGNEGIRPSLEHLVGWSAERREKHPLLSTNQAYDLAYRKIYDALPNCRNCSCIDVASLIHERSESK